VQAPQQDPLPEDLASDSDLVSPRNTWDDWEAENGEGSPVGLADHADPLSPGNTSGVTEAMSKTITETAYPPACEKLTALMTPQYDDNEQAEAIRYAQLQERELSWTKQEIAELKWTWNPADPADEIELKHSQGTGPQYGDGIVDGKIRSLENELGANDSGVDTNDSERVPEEAGVATNDSENVKSSTTSCGSPVFMTAVASATTPPTCAQNKRGGRDISAETRPDKRIKKMTQFDELPPSHLAPVQAPAPSPLSLCRKEDWQLHVDDYFALKGGVGVKERQAEKMWALLMVWRSMHANNVAHFEVQSDTNVYGFTSVRVLDRASWDAQMLQLGLDLSRRPKKEPVSTVYEIMMEYGGMQVDRSSGAKEPRNKSLKQDSYTFNAGHFAATKESVNRTRTAKRT
jgi:hypothetical protein